MIARFFGMDIHKRFAMIVAVDSQQEVIQPVIRVEMDELSEWAASHLTGNDEVVIEATTNAWQVYDQLTAYAGQVVVANPYKTKLIAQARIKSDKVDALALARLLASHFICQVWVPDTPIREQRALAAHRATLQAQSTRVKNRLHNVLRRHNLTCPHSSPFSPSGREWLSTLELSLTDNLQIGHLLRQLDLLQDELDEADRLIARLSAQDPQVPRLMELTGIGYYTAFSILATVADIQRFPSANNLASYAGLVPSLHQSGNRSFNGHITRQGNPLLRWLLVEAARAAVRFDPRWKHTFDAIRRRRGSNVAIVAVARKLLVVIWHLLYHHTNYHDLQPQTFVSKLQEWAYRIGRPYLPAPSAKDFVSFHLIHLGLQHLASSLVSDKTKGHLLVPAA